MNYYRIRKAHTTDVLGDTEVYTSDPINMIQYDRLHGIVAADENGTLDIEQSIDGINWDIKETLSITGGTAQSFDVKVCGEFMQLTYTNGSTPQTEFRLAAYATPMGGTNVYVTP